MCYPNEPSRAGFFRDNVLVKPLRQILEVEEYRHLLTDECAAKLEEFFLKKNHFRPVMTSLNEEVEESETAMRVRESHESEQMVSPFFPNGPSQSNLHGHSRQETLKR